jgi:hypothetical protein
VLSDLKGAGDLGDLGGTDDLGDLGDLSGVGAGARAAAGEGATSGVG